MDRDFFVYSNQTLTLVVLFSHLILDDVGHWIYKLKLHSFPVGPQINWLYPFTKYSSHKMIEGTGEVLRTYLFKAWPVSIMELMLVTYTLIVLFKG